MFRWYTRMMKWYEGKIENALIPYTRLPEPPPKPEPLPQINIGFKERFIPLIFGPVGPRELRAARITANGGTFTKADWQQLLRRDKQCLCCGTIHNLTADHVVPIAKGGQHAFSNMQVLCKSCNSKKGTQTIDYRGR